MHQLDGTYLQCCQCGNIFRVKHKVEIDILYTDEWCPCCHEDVRVLNLGEDNLLDKYEFYDSTLDTRYYTY